MTRALFASCALCFLLPARVHAAGRLILDETSYHRVYIQFGPDRISPSQLKQEGEKVLSKRLLLGLKREVRSVSKLRGKEWNDANWMNEAYVLYRQGQAWSLHRHGRMNLLAATPPPTADWTTPRFDDSGWPRLRGSLMVGTPPPGSRDDVDTLGRRKACLRYRFRVPDPAKAGELNLRLVYHGGARVFLNGREIARGHLPAGDLKPDTPGADYPLHAYVALSEDGSIPTFQRGRAKGVPLFADDFYGSFDDASGLRGSKGRKLGRHGRWGRGLDRANWDRLRSLRDRTIGPTRIPQHALRPGTNVLAVEIRAADLHPVVGGYKGWRTVFDYANYLSVSWFHAQLIRLELRGEGDGVPSARRRPKGVQVWVEDVHHRVFSPEFSDLGDDTGTVRFVGSLNGTFAAQVVVGTDRALTGLKALPTDLRLAGGAGTIPARALTVAYMVPHPVTDLGYLARSGRGKGRTLSAAAARNYLQRFGAARLDVTRLPDDRVLKEAQRLFFFDHVAPDPPGRVPADACHPIWLTLKVPPDARPGTYRGTVRVEADGIRPMSVPVAAEVLGWRVPDTPDWQVVMQLEQSPYGVAEHYQVPPWSEKHFQLVEASLRQLGRLGNDWLFVPVLHNTELGNLADSPIRWIRRKDGSLAFDYARMDRYVDLAVKHWGRPRVICFLVSHGGKSPAIAVSVHDEKTGQTKTQDMSSRSPTYRRDWRAFGQALFSHMQARGLAESTFWGFRWDMLGDPALPGILNQVAPGVAWAAGGHGHGYEPIMRAYSKIYNVPYGIHSRKGWKRRDICLLNPRGGGTVLGLSGVSKPAAYRLVIDRALVAGCNGLGRIGGDYWNDVYFRGCKAWHYLVPGMAVPTSVLWPGRDGADPSQRFEVLREGVQEAEARIFLEQALDRSARLTAARGASKGGALPPELAQRAQDVLFHHNRANFFVPVSASSRFLDYFARWQDRSRRLFGVAADVAAVAGLDLGRAQLAADVPARGKQRVTLKLRNWTPAPRKWTVETDAPWIVPQKTAGTALGHEELSVILDATALPPAKPAQGKLTVTDVASGNTFPVDITASVTRVLDFIPPDLDTKRQWFGFRYIPHKGMFPFNVATQGRATREVIVLNRSSAAIAWKAAASVPWIQVRPAAGKVAPQSPITLSVTVAPEDKDSAYHRAVLTIAEANGPASIRVPLAVHVIPPYRRPARPAGQAVPLDAALYKALIKTYRGSSGAQVGAVDIADRDKKRLLRPGQTSTRCLRGGGPYEAVFHLDGKGFAAFSAEVGFPKSWMGVVGLSFYPGPADTRLNYEVYVDGALRTQSGMMGPKDDLRLLVVRGLRGAKELRLVGRTLNLPGDCLHVFWFDPQFYK